VGQALSPANFSLDPGVGSR